MEDYQTPPPPQKKKKKKNLFSVSHLGSVFYLSLQKSKLSAFKTKGTSGGFLGFVKES
jgi:hypothetical protein